ncbi:MAG: indolepyruvate ferredoxin oxidoreductase subunit alpha [Clostridiales Family XIII bacterium]|jgi:indolepyruvate ferredoxin oxidoreductase alpha subunit|nr:indolepyruvate ferredoxin oxidoreductase subunit alpha [Clostridiales Family XIII bacterium]
MNEKRLLTGNEAVALGAWEAGLLFASAYPGTPSTEILENLANYKEDLYCEWAPNEKVAFEAAIGASLAGVRSLVAMKHVGVNVAADPLFTFSYTGVNGGFVLISADDPGMHSSQNEQDNRNYAAAARIPMLEPSDSAEAKEFVKLAFTISEKFDCPVMLRLTTRVCHSKSIVTLGARVPVPVIPYKRNIAKYVATPANAKLMRERMEEREKSLAVYSNGVSVNVAEYSGRKVGVVCAGVAYQYARDAFGNDASYLKLGMTYPMPIELVRTFASNVDTLYVVEELDPYMERMIKAAGIDCVGKERVPATGELDADILRKSVFGLVPNTLRADTAAAPRPPSLCAGCPHTGIFYVLSKKKNVMVTGDIGCYTLASAPPLSAIDSCFCMGGGISAGHGAAAAFSRAGSPQKVVAVIGDSTFFHSGVTSLMDAVYNKGSSVSVILDNRTTGMTGHQENPGTGFTLMGEETAEVDIPALCKALGVKGQNIYIVDPLILAEVDAALEDALAKDEPTVIIARRPCVLKKFSAADKSEFDLSPRSLVIDGSMCVKCGVCVKTGCPAIRSAETVSIDKAVCTGCGICGQVCMFGAIGPYAEGGDGA